MQKFPQELMDHPEITDQFSLIGRGQAEKFIESFSPGPGLQGGRQVKMRVFGVGKNSEFPFPTVD